MPTKPRLAVEMVVSASRRAFLDKTGMRDVACLTAQREHVAAIARKRGWKWLAPLELRGSDFPGYPAGASLKWNGPVIVDA